MSTVKFDVKRRNQIMFSFGKCKVTTSAQGQHALLVCNGPTSGFGDGAEDLFNADKVEIRIGRKQGRRVRLVRGKVFFSEGFAENDLLPEAVREQTEWGYDRESAYQREEICNTLDLKKLITEVELRRIERLYRRLFPSAPDDVRLRLF
jgi:hypothetical protein